MEGLLVVMEEAMIVVPAKRAKKDKRAKSPALQGKTPKPGDLAKEYFEKWKLMKARKINPLLWCAEVYTFEKDHPEEFKRFMENVEKYLAESGLEDQEPVPSNEPEPELFEDQRRDQQAFEAELEEDEEEDEDFDWDAWWEDPFDEAWLSEDALPGEKTVSWAQTKAEQAAENNPGDPSAWFNLGNIYLNATYWKGAVEAYNKALALNPKNPQAWFNLGNAHRDLKNYPRAVEAYEQVLSLDPKNTLAWFNLGVARYALKDFAHAAEAYEQALVLDPKYTQAWFNLGSSRYNLNNLKGAAEAIERALSLDPKQTNAWLVLGCAKQARGDQRGAVEAYGHVLAHDPWRSKVWNLLGNAFESLERLNEALYCYKRNIALGGRDGQMKASVLLARGITPREVQLPRPL